jgi:DNA-binding MarR family transcriptional regulator
MVTSPYRGLANIDRFIHEPARLSILTALLDNDEADYVLLLYLTGLGKGNLSTQLRKLEEVGLVRTERSFVRRKTRTAVELTEEGRSAIEGYLAEIERLHKQRVRWARDELERVRDEVFRRSYGDPAGMVTSYADIDGGRDGEIAPPTWEISGSASRVAEISACSEWLRGVALLTCGR